jgi:hypothetical protein
LTETRSALQLALSDRYRLERELGRGGMATVYLAKDLKHDRDVAIKVLHQDLGAALGAERFLAEIRTTARLQHPHILPLLDSGEADGLLYYVMPYVSGESLRDRLTRERQLPIQDAVRIAREVADALGEAHAHDIVHRDIKPENILLRAGHALVADFGIALAVSAAADGRMTESGFTLGTPKYMSPEQATAEKEITSRSDIYSLGCVLYEMLSGTPPHTGATTQQILMKIVTEEVTPVARLRKAVPPNVSAAVGQSLEKIPADRFESAKEFADALANPTYATMRGVASAVAVPERRWSRDPRSIGVASVAAIAGVALVWALTRPIPTSGPMEYDVGFPDSAKMTTEQGIGFDVAPSGDFVVYQATGGGASGLWYRSLRDQKVRWINGTERGAHAVVSPDGSKLAFLRAGSGNDWTLETVPIEGGTAAVLGRGSGYADLMWSQAGLQVVESGQTKLRSFDAASGRLVSEASISLCATPSQMPDGRLLCGGRGPNFGYFVESDAAKGFENLWTHTSASDSAWTIGTHFRLVEGRYLVYLSTDGDLLAAPVDVQTRRVGRSVRLINGIARRADTGTGAYELTPSGALVYAQGVDHAVGNIVAIDEHSVDTLNVGSAAFKLFSPSPDGARLAAVVSGVGGEELRVYDLRTGAHDVWGKGASTHPVWNARGDRLIFGSLHELVIGALDQTTKPELVYRWSGDSLFEAFAWGADDRLVADNWGPNVVVSLDLKRTPPAFEPVAQQAAFPSLSPDGRWISYASRSFDALWLQPYPANGKRYQVATGEITTSHWLSPTELTMAVKDSSGVTSIDRATIDFSGPAPAFHRQHWLTLPDVVPLTGPSYALTHDGKVLYLRGAPERPVTYLRVVPDWVSKMKRAVDEANR